ncbi:MAG: COX15/CtaA family protein [Terriglobales bacterium]
MAWTTVGYTLVVILWGAYVRMAGAGNGCGPNWPLCDGQFLPSHPQLKMLIEFLHRASSGLDGVLVLALAAGAFWLYPRHHRVRWAATAAAIFMIAEALLGAALVLFGWVGNNLSGARIAADALHLCNTLLLLGSVALTAAFASGLGGTQGLRDLRERRLLGAGLIAVMLTAALGAMTAVADTVLPSPSLAAGWRADFSSTSMWLQRVRVLHPVAAIATGIFLLWLLVEGLKPTAATPAHRLGWALAATVLLQWGLGGLDVILLAPVSLQVLHLFTADLLWVLLVLWSAARLSSAPSGRVAMPAPDRIGVRA